MRVTMAAGLSCTKTRKQDVEVEEQKLCLSETEREGVLLTKDDSAVLPAIKWMTVVYVLPRDRKKSTTSTWGEISHDVAGSMSKRRQKQ